MEGKRTVERDWATLPHEVLNLIAKKLRDLFDFVRFRAVCTSWFSSTPITDCPPQFPWILEEGYGPNLRFYSIPLDKLFTVNSAKFAHFDNSNLIEGYMPVLQNSRLVLLNPLCNHEVPLPSYDFDTTEDRWFTQKMTCKGKPVVFCGICDSESEFKMVFCNVGQENWHVLNLNPDIQKCDQFYLNNRLFVVERYTGVTKVIDVTTGSLAYVIPPVKDHVSLGSVHLVETSEGILRFFQHYGQSRVFSRNDLFDVHRLDVSENGSSCWVEVKNIGNYAFFVDMRGGFVLKANSLAGIKANSMYLLEDIFLHNSRGYIYQVRRIDIETSATELLPFPFKSPAGWFVPSLHHQ